MKSLTTVALAVALGSLLCACASPPQVHAEFGAGPFTMGPTSASDPRLRSPHFYMDEGNELPAWVRAAPMTNE